MFTISKNNSLEFTLSIHSALVLSCLLATKPRLRKWSLPTPAAKILWTSLTTNATITRNTLLSISIAVSHSSEALLAGLKGTMTAARLSPTANLLRQSRLFALPPTLSPPAKAATSSRVFESDTATLPYPIRASIATPDSSLARGDWGLKRPLPAKSTTQSSSNPVVRINQLDTFEHITDFESASDHVVTLKKWQELSIPISRPRTTGISIRAGGGRHESVFESTTDNTDGSLGQEEVQRYRFRGPWLAGQTDVEFDTYLKTARRQKSEFLSNLRELVAARRLADSRRKAMDSGKDLSGLRNAAPLTDEQFETALRQLRANPAALGPAIYQFLDLAPPPRVPSDRVHVKRWGHPASNVATTEYAQAGPPVTHPSAGLSYLRTGALVDNHASFGPQIHSKPAIARILKPKRRQNGSTFKAVAGVAGVVTEDINAHAFREINGPSGISDLDPYAPGGAKYWVRPVLATINPAGKVKLYIDRATDTAKAIHGVLPPKEPLPDFVPGQGLRPTIAPLKHTSTRASGGASAETKDFLDALA
ncbi:hypothetical protein AJ80_03322 [Polytolypa hystricis UAMH7299]|uniref:Mitochondrial ribosomal protein MRP51 n=1 Tax=Polytolypa hystricis (strain UAMH7299) TaxID=1447883 RepID=A0A2B7YJD0_POLH7|nr:hypothetical protein AJ80_03322 [Polytolypa hystricis UAMH7299]